MHGKLPNAAELKAYKTKLKALRGLPANLKAALEWIPASAHPMDVMRTGVSVLGTVLPEKEDHNVAGREGYRRPPDGLARLDAAVLVSLFAQRQAHRSRNRRRFHRRALPASAAWRGAVEVVGRCDARTSLNLYAEHEFNASTFTGRVIAGTGSDMYSAITGAIGALRGPKHGGANEAAFEIQSRYRDARRSRSRHQAPRGEQGSRDRLRPSGVHDLRSAQQGHQGSREESVEGSAATRSSSISPSASKR